MERWIWVCLVPFLFGCATTHSLPLEDQTRVYDAHFDTVFDATLETLKAEGFEFYYINYWEGVIETAVRLDPESPLRTLVVASVSEREEGVQLFFVYVMTDMYSETWVTEPMPCTPVCPYRGPCGCRSHFDVITRTSAFSPIFTKAKARQFYSDLFARVEQAF